MSGFTPGPWTAKDGYVSASGFRLIRMDSSTLGPPSREREANARLIAAAPDLLEALTEYVAPFANETDERLRERAHLSPAIARLLKARAAIARATGEQG